LNLYKYILTTRSSWYTSVHPCRIETAVTDNQDKATAQARGRARQPCLWPRDQTPYW